MIDFIGASPIHVGPIANRMREIDILEAGLTGFSPKGALRHGIMYGSAYTVMLDGQPVGMFGVVDTSLMGAEGRVWALFTKEAVKHPRAFLQIGPRVLSQLTRGYRRLSNMVHADNAPAIRWLKRMGFEVKEVQDVNGHPMRAIELCVDQQHLS